MTVDTGAAVGVDACPLGWIVSVIDAEGLRTNVYEDFSDLVETYSEADRILVDIPIGLPDEERRRCDEVASDLLGSRGLSVFYPPCRTAIQKPDYEEANAEHRRKVGYGLSQQAHSIRHKIREVREIVSLGGSIKESHPELCFAALNGQPIAYSKTSDSGLGFRMKLLSDAIDGARAQYQETRDEYFLKEVRRDDILDSMVLAFAAQCPNLTTAPVNPEPDEPRIHYPEFEVPASPAE